MLLDYLAAFRFLLSGQGEHALAIFKAHYFFLQSLGNLTPKRRLLPNSASENTVGRYNGSIVWDFFIGGKKSITID